MHGHHAVDVRQLASRAVAVQPNAMCAGLRTEQLRAICRPLMLMVLPGCIP